MTAVPILTFHDIAADAAVEAFPPERFAALMGRLCRRGWRSLPLPALVEMIRARRALPRKHLVITFDDGYRSVIDVAPTLDSVGFTASVFVSVGDGAVTDGPAPPGNNRMMLTWADVADLGNRGWHIGAHGLSHADLTTMVDSAVISEVVGSAATIAERTGGVVEGFSYPFGRVDKRVRDLVAANAAFAVSDRLAAARLDDDTHALPRVEMFYFRRRPLAGLVGSAALGPTLPLINGPRRMRRRVASHRV